MKAAYLGLFEEVGKGLGLPQRDLKVVFGSSPLMCRCRGDTRDRLREAAVRPKQNGSGADQLTSKRPPMIRK